MKLFQLAPVMVLAMIATPAIRAGEATSNVAGSLTWSKGPALVDLQIGATFSLPDGFLFLDGPGTRKLLAEFGNKASGHEIGFLTPMSRTWFVIVEHLDLGYIKDDNRQALDPSLLLRRLQKSDEGANAERERNGWPTVTVQDWAVPPRYDEETHSIEWAVRAETGGRSVVNHTISLLGRKGAVQFSLIDPDQRTSSVAVFRELVRGISFAAGNRYVDHQPGDPIAQGGLTALVGEGTGVETEGESVDHPAPAENSNRAALAWKSPWLVAILAAAVAGFVCGRFARGRNKHHRGRLDRAHETRAPVRRRKDSPTPKSPTPSATPIVPGATGGQPPSSTAADGTRIKRYDSYSFYCALTRDLHWTINY